MIRQYSPSTPGCCVWRLCPQNFCTTTRWFDELKRGRQFLEDASDLESYRSFADVDCKRVTNFSWKHWKHNNYSRASSYARCFYRLVLRNLNVHDRHQRLHALFQEILLGLHTSDKEKFYRRLVTEGETRIPLGFREHIRICAVKTHEFPTTTTTTTPPPKKFLIQPSAGKVVASILDE